jgi:hypothetical protein
LIYDGKSQTNEEDSAEQFMIFAKELGLVSIFSIQSLECAAA